MKLALLGYDFNFKMGSKLSKMIDNYLRLKIAWYGIIVRVELIMIYLYLIWKTISGIVIVEENKKKFSLFS